MIQASAMARRGEYVNIDMNHDFDTLNKRHIQLLSQISPSDHHLIMPLLAECCKIESLSYDGHSLPSFSSIVANSASAFNNKHPSDMV